MIKVGNIFKAKRRHSHKISTVTSEGILEETFLKCSGQYEFANGSKALQDDLWKRVRVM